MWCPCSPRRATGSSYHICAAMEPRAFFQARRCETASNRRLLRTSSTCWTRLKSRRRYWVGSIGGAHSRHYRGSLGGTLQSSRLGEWLSHRQPEGRQGAIAAAGGVPMVVPILFHHRARQGRLRQIPPRVFEAHLAAGLTEMEVRRGYVCAECSRVRQSRSCKHCHSQLSMAAWLGRRRGQI